MTATIARLTYGLLSPLFAGGSNVTFAEAKITVMKSIATVTAITKRFRNKPFTVKYPTPKYHESVNFLRIARMTTNRHYVFIKLGQFLTNKYYLQTSRQWCNSKGEEHYGITFLRNPIRSQSLQTHMIFGIVWWMWNTRTYDGLADDRPSGAKCQSRYAGPLILPDLTWPH